MPNGTLDGEWKSSSIFTEKSRYILRAFGESSMSVARRRLLYLSHYIGA